MIQHKSQESQTVANEARLATGTDDYTTSHVINDYVVVSRHFVQKLKRKRAIANFLAGVKCRCKEAEIGCTVGRRICRDFTKKGNRCVDLLTLSAGADGGGV